MTGNIINQGNSTLLNQVEDSKISAKAAKSTNPRGQVSSFSPGPQLPYDELIFQESLGFGPGISRFPITYPGPILGKAPTPVGNPNIVPTGISYFDIEGNSTYFQEVGGSTYYVVT